MDLDIKSCRSIYKIWDKYHFMTGYKYKNDKQRFKITIYCKCDCSIKQYPYRFVTEKLLLMYIINKFRGKYLIKIRIEPIVKN
ncbi:CNPV114 HT motif protein [Canarypox virus]|uniref:SWPV2-ORF109 n=2 Tax=Canarypox virus TaxID=44088 RepID=A0A1V0QG79_CNPV|nr:CNPV114 HT motif protein [Canarypox virus]ARE67333.1 SWPV2-ORF109 [Shearwaterpox virus]QRM15747.1 ht motif protein [Penguinpox virus 2]QRM16079.1 ht motif protein [Albatrosspox virus]UWX11258.1 CRPV-149 [Crowpox virus]AAR83460.1 CNPV114 HT motif protein [Canarypox virus]